MRKTYFEKDGGLRREVYGEDGRLYLSVTGKGEKADVGFLFEFGPDNEKDAKELWGQTDWLAKNNRGGLMALLRYAAEPDEQRLRSDCAEDGEWSGVEGSFRSSLEVREQRMIYTLEMLAVGCCGEAKFDLGLAHKGRLSKLRKLIEGFEDYLMCFVYTVKHHYIDSMNVDPLEELVEE